MSQPQPLRVLVVEDSEDDTDLLLLELRRGGYQATCLRVDTAQAMEAALERLWDIVICDYNMPHFSALVALDLVHQRGLDIPFIILSGTIGEDTAVTAMKAGAHDYVMKGDAARLLPAIQRELREAGERIARRQAEQALAESEKRYRTMVDTANDAIVALDARGRMTYVNARTTEMLGLAAAELLGRRFSELVHEADREFWSSQYRLLRGGKHLLVDLRLRRKDGGELWVINSSSPLQDEESQFTGSIVMLKDVTERKLAEDALAHAALHDALTGLPNRTLLQDRLEQAMLASRRENWRLAVLLIDLDRFKEVNDAFGHQYGDALLKQVGARLRGTLRESDTVARLGGDEFAVVLPNCSDPNDGCVTAANMLKALEEPFVIDHQTLNVTGSIGVVLYPEHGDNAQTLMRHADVAMYAAKREGDGVAVYADEQEMNSANRLTMSNQLRRGIEQGELVAYFQPKISLQTSELIGVEALVRWQHPDRGLVPPDDFIPLAEQTGLIKPLSVWMLSAVLDQSRAWDAEGLRLTVAVNLSMRNLHDPNLPDLIASLLHDFGVGPDALQLEITETVLMTNAARTLEVITRLSAMGIHLSIDDFGTGYSSLAYLKRLPVAEIKIDKSFVHDMTTDENDLTIVRSTIDLGHNLGLEVVAEGVETEGHWRKLQDLGCDLAQGYYFAKPMSAEAFAYWMKESRWSPEDGLARRSLEPTA